jgi:hypothetical protein
MMFHRGSYLKQHHLENPPYQSIWMGFMADSENLEKSSVEHERGNLAASPAACATAMATPVAVIGGEPVGHG